MKQRENHRQICPNRVLLVRLWFGSLKASVRQAVGLGRDHAKRVAHLLSRFGDLVEYGARSSIGLRSRGGGRSIGGWLRLVYSKARDSDGFPVHRILGTRPL
jgi:hypothetical protein